MTVLNYQEILQLCKFTEPKAVETNDGAIQVCEGQCALRVV